MRTLSTRSFVAAWSLDTWRALVRGRLARRPTSGAYGEQIFGVRGMGLFE
jgi:hypothetical protein